MSAIRDTELQMFREETGLEPALGIRRRLLKEVQEEAFELIKFVELEIAGIRDGDGKWSASDPVLSAIEAIRVVGFQLEQEVSKKTAAVVSIPIMTPAEARQMDQEDGSATSVFCSSTASAPWGGAQVPHLSSTV